jgi:hypothetical protein
MGPRAQVTVSPDGAPSLAHAAGLTTPLPVTIDPGATVAEAARRMQMQHVNRLLVADDRGRLIGRVSRVDVLTTFLTPTRPSAAASWTTSCATRSTGSTGWSGSTPTSPGGSASASCAANRPHGCGGDHHPSALLSIAERRSRNMRDATEAQPWRMIPFDQMCQIDPPIACTACAPGVTVPSQCPKPFLLDDDQLAEVARRWAMVRAKHRRPAGSGER